MVNAVMSGLDAPSPIPYPSPYPFAKGERHLTVTSATVFLLLVAWNDNSPQY